MNPRLLLRPLASVVGTLAAATLVWFAGPTLSVGGVQPLGDAGVRWAVIGALVALVVAQAAWRRARAARRNRELVDGLAAGAPASGATSAGAQEVALIGKRFDEALALLKREQLGSRRSRWFGARSYVYDLPWYVIIGAPGAGKTTALVNSGLEFPLAKQLGHKAVRGVGGTRHCDWWFTREAVLIDTAGRYTTQDSDREADRTAWNGFLDLLARHRPRRPINGVLLTVSASDLLHPVQGKRVAHAHELRARIDELHARFGIRFPVYVLVTKTDLLAGFMEFFADFDKDERAQVWGVTFPHAAGDADAADPMTRISSELAALEKRLDECLIERLHGEHDRERRAAIYAFPQQWRVLREALAELLREAFAGTPEATRALVRGVYFTSATQEGTPMDRALGGLARALGLARRVVPPSRPSGKTFFVTRLLRDVVFAEAGLASTNLRWERRRGWLEWGVVGATATLVTGAVGLAWLAWLDNRAYVEAVAARAAAIEPRVAAAKASAPTDLAALVPVLDAIEVAGRPADGAAAALPPWLALGLDQSATLSAAAADAYRHLLKEALQPRIAARLAARLDAGAGAQIESIYEALKAYLMLFGGSHFDRQALRAYLLAEVDATWPAGADPARRDALRRHLDALLAAGEIGAPSQADAALIARTRALVARVPLPQRIYQRLQQQGGGAPEFSIEGAAGAAAGKLFVRASGESLARGVPSLYSRGFAQQSLRQRSLQVHGELQRETDWVLASPPDSKDAPTAPALVHDEVERLYAADFLKRWEALVDDLRLAAPATLAAGAELAQALARTDSPLAALLGAIARETTLGAAARSPLAAVDERFDALRRYVAAQPAPIEEAIGLLGKLAAHLAAVDDAARRRILAPSSQVTRELAAAAQRAPEPVRAMLSTLAASSASQWYTAVRERIAAQLSAELAPGCTRAVEGRYPLLRTADKEMSRDEFARAFGSGGLLDAFFQRQLAPFVDTSARAWSVRRPDGSGDATESLQAFQRAQTIRDAFFRDGGRALGVRLELRLLDLDPGLTQFTLDVDGQSLRFTRDSRQPQALQWPGPSAAGRVQVQAGGGSGYAFDGEWSLLRLLDRVRTEPGSTPDRVTLVFDVEGRKARFESKSASPVNPIGLLEREPFICPKRL